MPFNFFRLFKILPLTLKISWGFILIGFLALTAACFTGSVWQGFGGMGCLLVGYLVFLIDGINPNRSRGDAARVGFYAGILGATLVALIVAIVSALLVAIAFAVASLTDRTIPLTAIESLYYIGTLFAFSVVNTLPKIALKVEDETETEQGADE